jgi:hypothetical protein
MHNHVRFVFGPAIAIAFAVTGCGSPMLPGSALVLNERSSSVLTASRDPVTILGATVTEDLLSVDVRYGGGCAEHAFSLHHSGIFRESYPVHTDMTLAHDAGGDACRALIQRTLEFDLTPVKTLYQRSYGATNGVIDVSLGSAGEPGAMASFRYEF